MGKNENFSSKDENIEPSTSYEKIKPSTNDKNIESSNQTYGKTETVNAQSRF